MALSLLSHLSLLPASSLSPPSHSQPTSITVALSQRMVRRNVNLQHGSFHGIRVPSTTYAFGRKRSVIVQASSEIDGKEDSNPDPLPPSQGKEDEAVAAVENLPLESKLKERMEQKLRMKLAKKIRLRRKRLLRKRKMRKKGRWPPSKMKKLKNV